MHRKSLYNVAYKWRNLTPRSLTKVEIYKNLYTTMNFALRERSNSLSVYNPISYHYAVTDMCIHTSPVWYTTLIIL